MSDVNLEEFSDQDGSEEKNEDISNDNVSNENDRTPDVKDSIASMMNVPMTVSIVLGKSRLPVSQILKLGRGSVVELDKRIGDPVDVMINDKVIARGELMKVDDRLGVTLTEIMKDHFSEA